MIQSLRLRPDQVSALKGVPGVRKTSGGYWRVPLDLRLMYALQVRRERPLAAVSRPPPRGLGSIAAHLRPSQCDDINFALDHEGALIAHPTSGGKTLIGLGVALAVGGPALFCGPALSRWVWTREVEKWAPERTLYVCRGRTPDPAALAHDWVFCNYEILKFWAPLFAEQMWEVHVLDEIHELRSRRAQCAVAARMSRGISVPLVLGLSATPVWSKIPDLYNVLDLIRPGWFGSQSAFMERYAGAVPDLFGGLKVGRATNGKELRARLKYTMRRLDKATLLPDLPPLQRERHRIAHEIARQRMTETLRALARTDAAPDRELFLAFGRIARRETYTKIEALAGLLEWAGTKRAIVLTELRESARAARDVLTKAGWPTLGFDGASSVSTRMKAVDRARAMDRVALCCTAPSVRQSVDCTGFDAAWILEFPWTAEALLQEEGRVHRHGVDVPITVHYVVLENTFDSHLCDMLLAKLDDRARAVGMDDLDGGLRDALREPPDLKPMLARMGLGE